MDTTHEEVITHLKNLVNSKGVKVVFIAEHLGISTTFFYQALRGERKLSSERLLMSITLLKSYGVEII